MKRDSSHHEFLQKLHKTKPTARTKLQGISRNIVTSRRSTPGTLKETMTINPHSTLLKSPSQKKSSGHGYFSRAEGFKFCTVDVCGSSASSCSFAGPDFFSCDALILAAFIKSSLGRGGTGGMSLSCHLRFRLELDLVGDECGLRSGSS